MFDQSEVFMSFGKMPIANNFLKKNNFKDEFFFNMDVAFDKKFSLLKLANHPKPEQMFNENYKFFSSTSSYMKKHFYNYSEELKKIMSTKSNKVIEIGCNDGIMLRNFKNDNFNAVGFEPSVNVAQIARKNGLNVIDTFFSSDTLNDKSFIKNTSLIYAANVICHIPDLDGLIKNIDKLLSPEGIFVFEEPYLGSMFEKVSYDQIYDEHIYIFSVSSIKKIFNEYGFDLFDAKKQSTHGGSMRYYLCRKNDRKINENVKNYLDNEKLNNLDNLKSCLDFKKNCEWSKEKLLSELKKFKENKKTISGYAATSKSTTVLNYCNIDSKIIDCIYDTTPDKIGKFSPGMHIPIVDSKNFKKNYPDIAFLFAWNHKNEIFEKEKDFVENGGKWFSHINLAT